VLSCSKQSAIKMASKSLHREQIERWIAFANILPTEPAEELIAAEVRRKFDRLFGRKPQLARADLGQHLLAEKVYKGFERRERAGQLMLEVTRPIERRRGRPSHSNSVQRVETFTVLWEPRDNEQLSNLARSVSGALKAIVAATEAGVRELRAGRKSDRHECAPIELPVSEFKPVVGFNPGGQGVIWPDPYRQFLSDLNGTDLSRIRRCPVCRRLFFARRRDKGACSPPCLNVNRVQTFRSLQKRKEYRDNRKWNEYRKSEMKEKRSIIDERL
jgi:hypothetical protein